MATISSPGIGSGLDIKSIVSQLVAIEKQPLTQLQVQAATVQTRISAFGQIKSLVSTLSDAASRLGSLTTFNAVTAASSNNDTVSATAIGGTAVNSFSVKVENLAKAQATASAALLPVGGALGAGTLRLQLGEWTIVPSSFTPQSGGGQVDIVVSATDTVSDVASKINGAGAGVTATVLNDASGERLLLRSNNTGVAAGFELSIVSDADGDPADAAGLSRLVNGSSIQYAEDARMLINTIPVTSSTNKFENVVSGVTLTAKAVSADAAEVTVAKDRSVLTQAIDSFVSAYNAVNQAINEQTKYDPSSKEAGLLQGDATAIGLQNALRGILQSATSGSAYERLADVGITQQLGGDLAVDSAKLEAAINNGDELKNLLRIDNGNALTNGVASKFSAFAKGLLATDGLFSSKDASLKRSLERNADDQARLNDKVARVEAALNRRYSALDVQLSSLNALNAYVTQQVTLWNQSSSSK
ncbi:MAG: flagellar filament capping protein FliD [Burkholderiaceae bacterium]|nr:flagellar filament capping protein FliD [Rhodoferax sp.]MCB2004668.1 flagellar filament capping protein FliD [Rhodoferax sp.]MCB2040171.1 flagellar filament capping protein FliD [Rhodoferax sp.]MCP5263189.1 flagellar filament capping protein FliD [Rhodoferax sp.]MCW5630188.1 flagellar filament capping protein FliD [Rhodoferax sp.]